MERRRHARRRNAFMTLAVCLAEFGSAGAVVLGATGEKNETAEKGRPTVIAKASGVLDGTLEYDSFRLEPGPSSEVKYAAAAYHAETGLYWWRPTSIASDDAASLLETWKFVVSEDHLTGISVSPYPPALWFYSSSLKVPSANQGRALALGEVKVAGQEGAAAASHRVPLEELLPADFAPPDSYRPLSIVGARAREDGWVVAIVGGDGRAASLMLDRAFEVKDAVVDPVRRRRSRLAPEARIPAAVARDEELWDGAEVHVLPPSAASYQRIENIVGGMLGSWRVWEADPNQGLRLRIYLTNTGGRPLLVRKRGDETWLDLVSLRISRDGNLLDLADLDVTVDQGRVLRMVYTRNGTPVRPTSFRAAGPIGFWEPDATYDEVLEVEEHIDHPPQSLATYERAEVSVTIQGMFGFALPTGDYEIGVVWDLSDRGLRLAGPAVRQHRMSVSLSPFP